MGSLSSSHARVTSENSIYFQTRRFARCFAVQHVQKDGIEFSDVTLACEDDNDNSDIIECAQKMVGTEFFNVTIAMDYHNHNEDSVSAKPRQGIVVVNNGPTSASYLPQQFLV